MTTKRIVNISIAALLIIALLLALCWFYVSGAKLRVLQAIPSDCEITVTATYWDGTPDNSKEFVYLIYKQVLSFSNRYYVLSHN